MTFVSDMLYTSACVGVLDCNEKDVSYCELCFKKKIKSAALGKDKCDIITRAVLSPKSSQGSER